MAWRAPPCRATPAGQRFVQIQGLRPCYASSLLFFVGGLNCDNLLVDSSFICINKHKVTQTGNTERISTCFALLFVCSAEHACDAMWHVRAGQLFGAAFSSSISARTWMCMTPALETPKAHRAHERSPQVVGCRGEGVRCAVGVQVGGCPLRAQAGAAREALRDIAVGGHMVAAAAVAALRSRRAPPPPPQHRSAQRQVWTCDHPMHRSRRVPCDRPTCRSCEAMRVVSSPAIASLLHGRA